MKKLTLIRHAKSDWNAAAASDFERTLNGRGKKAAPLIGQRLAQRGCDPDVLICSSAERARQTAKKIALEIDYPEGEIEYCLEIYEASRGTLINLIQGLEDSNEEAILIGHNPGFSELGEWLTAEAPDWLPTCGLLELELPIKHWSQVTEDCARLRYYDYPKKAQ